MFYRGRELRRLWRVKVFVGDKEDPDCPMREEQIVAWNQTHAIRMAPGDVVELPEFICYVSWPAPGKDETIYRVDSPLEGPLKDQPIKPTVAVVTEDF